MAVILDTSVFVAGLIARRGAASALVDAFFENRLVLAYTPAMLGEYAEVLERPEFSGVITPADRIGVILKIHTAGLLVAPASVPDADWPDVDDLPFIAAALATDSKVVVTLNLRDFEPAKKMGVRVLSAAGARRELL